MTTTPGTDRTTTAREDRTPSDQRVALVTGATGGIGRASAEALRRAGFLVYATGRDEAALARLAAEGFATLRLDVTDEQERLSAVRSVGRDVGRVDLLVNNAGYGVSGPLEQVDMDAVRANFETNVFGMLRLAQLVLPLMRAQGCGRIVNIGSVGGLFTAPGAGTYHMTKYAVEALSDAMRAEVTGFGVDVVLIEPTGVRTAFIDTQLSSLHSMGADDPYAEFKAGFATSSRALFEPGNRASIAVEDVAATVTRAATARRPRTRYRVGAAAHVLVWVRRLLSDRQWDRMALRQLR